jgi:hypothetical protein
MESSGKLRRVALVRTDVSEELSASIIRLTRIGELGTMLALTSIVPSSQILVALMKEALSSSDTSVLTRATRRNIPENAILQSQNMFSSALEHVFSLPSTHLTDSRFYTVPIGSLIIFLLS